MIGPTASMLEPMLAKLAYRAPLDACDREALLALPHRVTAFEPHDLIVHEQERVGQSCVLLSGFAVRHKIVADGLRQIVAVHLKGDWLDLQNAMLGVADNNVEALTHVDVAMIPAAAIRRLGRDRPGVAMAFWLDTLVDGAILCEWIANVGRRDAHARVAHLLCELFVRLRVAGLGTDHEYELPMTQEQIADAVGLTAVHVNRTLKVLEAEGLIRRTRRSVTISCWRPLAEAGDFDATYLHLGSREPALAH